MRALIAVDGSVHAAAVIEAVAPWLIATGATAEVITVVDPSEVRGTRAEEVSPTITPRGSWAGSALPIDDRPARVVDYRGQAISRIQAAAAERLYTLASAYLKDVPYEVRVVIGHDTADAILSEARRARADAIAIGSRGRGTLARAILGSVAQQVVMAAPVPIFLVRSPVPGP